MLSNRYRPQSGRWWPAVYQALDAAIVPNHAHGAPFDKRIQRGNGDWTAQIKASLVYFLIVVGTKKAATRACVSLIRADG
jgi:hypothetical protein